VQLARFSTLFNAGKNAPRAEWPDYALLRLTMQGVLLAALAVFLKFQAVRIITLAFFARVIPFLAIRAGHVNGDPNFFFCHVTTLPSGNCWTEPLWL
jgi:hypothetical protein